MSFVNEKTIDWQIDKIILKISADMKPFTAKPLTNLSQINTMTALMTNKKSPHVTIVTGKVKKTKIGFTNTFSKPSTTAMITDVVKDATVMPDMKWSMTKTRMAVRMMRMMEFMVIDIKGLQQKF